ncbi:MAG TPA: hypothetical protein VGJ73_12025 [Verrucomicrobiae bacterium]
MASVTETITIRLPKALAQEFRTKARAAGTTPSKVLSGAVIKFVRKEIVEHIRARAGTWDGDIPGEDLLRKTRRA